MRKQLPARMCQVNRFPLPVKEGNSKISLQGFDAMADGTLSQMQIAPGLGETSVAGQ